MASGTLTKLIGQRRNDLRAIKSAERDVDTSLEKVERNLRGMINLKKRLPTSDDLQKIIEGAMIVDRYLDVMIEKIKSAFITFSNI